MRASRPGHMKPDVSRCCLMLASAGMRFDGPGQRELGSAVATGAAVTPPLRRQNDDFLMPCLKSVISGCHAARRHYYYFRWSPANFDGGAADDFCADRAEPAFLSRPYYAHAKEPPAFEKLEPAKKMSAAGGAFLAVIGFSFCLFYRHYFAADKKRPVSVTSPGRYRAPPRKLSAALDFHFRCCWRAPQTQ